MLKICILGFFLLCMNCVLEANPPKTSSVEYTKLSQKCDSLHILLNCTIAKEYVKLSVKEGVFIPLNMFSEELVEVYCRKKADLQKIKTELAYADDEVNAKLMQDAEYYANENWYNKLSLSEKKRQRRNYDTKKSSVINRITQSDEEFIKIFNIRQKLQSAIYRVALGYMADEFLAEHRILDVSWIPETHRAKIDHKLNVFVLNWKYKRSVTLLKSTNTPINE